MSRGWWRRNRYALPAMVVALAVLAWPASETARDLWWPRGEHVARSPGDGGWAGIDGAELRLASFGPAEPLAGDPPPGGYAVWRAELETRSDDAEPRSCDAELEDAGGHRYAAGSQHLPSYEDESFGVECGSGEEPASVVYFLLPDGAEPRSVRVSAFELLPEYWLLQVR